MARRANWRKSAEHAVALPQPRPQAEESQGAGPSSESDYIEVECPLCLEPMDETDRTFFPCTCGYQICLYCFNRVKDKNDKCPACRKPYNPDEYQYMEPDEAEELARGQGGAHGGGAELDPQQLQLLQEQAQARARAMEAQARRCGACQVGPLNHRPLTGRQVEGPPIEPDPQYHPEPAPAPAPSNNSWASMAGGSRAGGWQGGRGGPASEGWNQWPALDGSGAAGPIQDADDWEALAAELANETGAPRRSRLLPGMNQRRDAEMNQQLDEEISRLQQEVRRTEAELATAQKELANEDRMYDLHQEKSAEMRVHQQSWDAGLMDLLSKWQGWTDQLELSEASHFEAESVLMAQLITHQQQMADKLTCLQIAQVAPQPQQQGPPQPPPGLSGAPPGLGDPGRAWPGDSGAADKGQAPVWGSKPSRMSSWSDVEGPVLGSGNAWGMPGGQNGTRHPVGGSGWDPLQPRGNQTQSTWGATGQDSQQAQGSAWGSAAGSQQGPGVWGGSNGMW